MPRSKANFEWLRRELDRITIEIDSHRKHLEVLRRHAEQSMQAVEVLKEELAESRPDTARRPRLQ